MTTATEYWRTRAETYGPGWCEHYWESWQAPHRVALAELMAGLRRDRFPCHSILEVGCHCGPNLRLLKSYLPDTWLQGVDASAEAIEFGREKFEREEPDPRRRPWLRHGAAPDAIMSSFYDEYDVVFSCYALAYMDDADLAKTLSRIVKIARLAVIIAEPMTDAEASYVIDEPSGERVFNFERILRSLCPDATVRTVSMPKVDNLDRALLVELA